MSDFAETNSSPMSYARRYQARDFARERLLLPTP